MSPNITRMSIHTEKGPDKIVPYFLFFYIIFLYNVNYNFFLKIKTQKRKSIVNLLTYASFLSHTRQICICTYVPTEYKKIIYTKLTTIDRRRGVVFITQKKNFYTNTCLKCWLFCCVFYHLSYTHAYTHIRTIVYRGIKNFKQTRK